VHTKPSPFSSPAGEEIWSARLAGSADVLASIWSAPASTALWISLLTLTGSVRTRSGSDGIKLVYVVSHDPLATARGTDTAEGSRRRETTRRRYSA
jgi:hypothetical protein